MFNFSCGCPGCEGAVQQEKMEWASHSALRYSQWY